MLFGFYSDNFQNGFRWDEPLGGESEREREREGGREGGGGRGGGEREREASCFTACGLFSKRVRPACELKIVGAMYRGTSLIRNSAPLGYSRILYLGPSGFPRG